MTLKEYIKEQYDISERVTAIIKDPVARVMESDDLPFDDIKMVDGVLQKVVYLNDGDEFVTVLEILMYERVEVEAMKECDFKRVWLAYAENIEESTMCDFRALSREYAMAKNHKEELTRKCTL